tara:strand:- start:754 stop:1683 length:930 start_codon:yes stop_codon:yes gene_type:complete
MKKNISKKYEMGQSVTSNYAGEAASGYTSAALLSNTTIINNELTVLNNVTYKANLRKITVAGAAGNLMADNTCAFTDSGTVTYAERVLTPKKLDVNTQVCKAEFLQSWEGANMTAGLNGTLPVDFADYILGQTAERVSQEIQQSIWDGNGANDGQFDGFKLLLAADADVNDVAAGAIDAANVVAELDKVVAAIPAAVYGKDDLKIWIPTTALQYYIQAQATLGFVNRFNMGTEFPLSFNGIEVCHAPGLANNTMVAGRTSNMFFGTDGSTSEVKLLDMADLDGSDHVRIVMRFNAGVNYAFGSDMVLYS